MMTLIVYLVVAVFFLFTLLAFASGEDRYRKWLATLSIVGTALAIFVAWNSVGIYQNYDFFYGDFWVVMEAMNKTKQGDLSSVDFFSPIGPAFYWVLGLTAFLTDRITASSMMHASAVAAVFSGMFCIGMLARRASFLGLTIALFAVVTVAISGRGNGEILSYAPMHFLAPYNRWGWALFIPIALRLALPKGDRDLLGDVFLGFAIALLVLMKISYGLSAIGLLVARAVILRGVRAECVRVLSVVVAAFIALEIVNGQFSAYLSDLVTTSALPQSGLRLARLMHHSGEWFIFSSFALVVYFVSAENAPEKPVRFESVLEYIRPGIFIMLVSTSGLAILSQNHSDFEAAIYSLLPLIALEWNRVLRANAVSALFSGYRARLMIVATVFLMMLLPVFDIGMYAAQRVNLSIEGRDPGFAGTPYSDLRYKQAIIDQDLSFLNRLAVGRTGVIEGYNALREAGAAREDTGTVVVLGFSNPFSVMLEKPSPTGTPIWLHENRSFTTEIYVPPETLFEDADYVMLGNKEATLWEIYRSTVEDSYELRFRGSYWTLFVKKGLGE